MLNGRIPNLTPDVRGDDRTASLAITRGASRGRRVWEGAKALWPRRRPGVSDR
jgi:hypothetical protein